MEFFEVIKKRRSIRKFQNVHVPEEIIIKSLEAAILAPNSSNVQAWDFYWPKNEEAKKKMILACLDQSAARTASELMVIVASPKSWKRSQPELIKWIETIKAPTSVVTYYKKLVPMMYQWGVFNSIGLIKKIALTIIGLFKPIMRGPAFKGEIDMVCVKSAALAAENFVLALSAQGFDTCMMEGFDECRVRKILKLNCSQKVVMVIAVGKASENGTWGPQFRLPLNQVLHRI